MAERDDIWFLKVLWGYVPCSLMGWAVTIAGVSSILLAIGAVKFAAYAFRQPAIEYLIVPVFVLGLWLLLRIADRHSKNWSN